MRYTITPVYERPQRNQNKIWFFFLLTIVLAVGSIFWAYNAGRTDGIKTFRQGWGWVDSDGDIHILSESGMEQLIYSDIGNPRNRNER